MKYIIFSVVVLLMFTYMFGFFNNDKINVDDKSSSIYSYSIDVIDGETISLNDFKGKKILFVNVASKCGYTPQYKQLQSLYEKYNDELMIVGFPANDFMWQEPGKNNQGYLIFKKFVYFRFQPFYSSKMLKKRLFIVFVALYLNFGP